MASSCSIQAGSVNIVAQFKGLLLEVCGGGLLPHQQDEGATAEPSSAGSNGCFRYSFDCLWVVVILCEAVWSACGVHLDWNVALPRHIAMRQQLKAS